MPADAALFDLNGTLLDPAVLAGPLGGDAEAEALVGSAFDLTIAQAMALTTCGDYVPFKELLEAALRQRVRSTGGDESAIGAAMGLTSRMPPFDHAAPALDALAGAGLRLAVLTNSSTSDAEQVLENAGLADRFEAVIGTDQVEAFKPDRRVYEYALDKLGLRPKSTWLVAAHWWDVLGAQRAGLRGAWAAHKEGVLVETVRPDARGEDLAEVAAEVTAAT